MDKDERYISVEQSIADACREVREMRAGRQPEPTMEDFFAEMNALIEQEKANATDTKYAPPTVQPKAGSRMVFA